VHRGLGPIALATFAMALRAFIHVDPLCSPHRGFRGRDRVLQFLHFLRHDPRLVSMENEVNERNANKDDEGCEQNFARLEIGLRVDGHGDQENSRTTERTTEANLAAVLACCALLRAEYEPDELGIEEEDGGGGGPGNDSRQSRVGKFAHLGTVTCKLD